MELSAAGSNKFRTQFQRVHLFKPTSRNRPESSRMVDLLDKPFAVTLRSWCDGCSLHRDVLIIVSSDMDSGAIVGQISTPTKSESLATPGVGVIRVAAVANANKRPPNGCLSAHALHLKGI